SFGGESGLRKVGLGGIHPLTQRYATVEKFLGFFIFVVFGYSFFGVGKSAFLPQVLESLKPSCMPRFVKSPH
ncbi:DUF3265 domain-containing protein, partial [Escherichia coli]|nr:DUF3265 domain-containing protein [Escherichia coli]